jgi:hypothetical protein
MKSKLTLRPVFLFLLLAMGAIVAIKGANYSDTKENKTKSTKTCCKKPKPSTSNSEFIFFDTFNRFLFISPIK